MHLRYDYCNSLFGKKFFKVEGHVFLSYWVITTFSIGEVGLIFL